MRRKDVLRLLLALFLMLAAAGPASAATRGLTVGFFDTSAFTGGDSATWLDRASATGGEIVRVTVSWPAIAPTPPQNPRNPADPVYRWETVDRFVAAARARGLTVLLSVDTGPRWAEGPGRPKNIPVGAWKPDPAAVGDFMEAVARRYATQARHFQVWNEPNLDIYLAPQWRRKGGRFVADAPHRYRRMLNAAFAGIRRVSPTNRLVTAGTAPYGDPEPGGRRTMPVRFWRSVLSKRARFDVLSHHPYGVGSPRRRALNRDDVAVPDMHKLGRLTRKPLWVTEVGWDSRPPDPNGVPAAEHAAWVSDTFFVLWKQGVRAITWFLIQDQAPAPTFAASNQSGMFLRDGRAKLSARAFAFPFACERRGRRLRVWTKAPAPGPVEVIDRAGRTVATLRAGSTRVAVRTVARRPGLRARQGDRTSLACRVIRPT